MKIFCVTGAPGSDLCLVENILAAAGVTRPRPSRLDPALDISNWHEQVLASVGQAERATRQQPGRLWEQLASSIFLENIASPLWGWADARSVWLLDFWREFETNLHFVLVCVSPQRALGLALSQDLDCDPAAVMHTWQQYHQELLRFHLRHPQRTLLVDAAQCEIAPQKLIDACASHWRLPLPGAAALPCEPVAIAPLANYLAGQFSQGHIEAAALQNELISSSYVLAELEPVRTTLLDAAKNFARLQEQANTTPLLQQQISEAQARSQQLQHDLQQRAAELTAQRLQHEKATGQNQQLIGEIAKLQGEHASRGKAITDLNEKIRTLHTGLSQSRQQLAELQQLQAQLQAQLEMANQGISNEQAENEFLLTKLRAVQQEAEDAYLQCQALDASLQAARVQQQQQALQLEEAARVEAHLQRNLDDAGQKNSQLEQRMLAQQASLTEREQFTAELHATQVSLDAAHKESELLLLQLHQVQGELEHYFLEYQTASLALKEMEAGWQRMRARVPDYCDYHSITGSIEEGQQDSASIHWHIAKLALAGRTLPELRFSTVVADGALHFVFNLADGEVSSGLLRWPAPGARQVRLGASRAALEQPGSALANVASSDMHLLQTLCRLLADALENGVVQIDEVASPQLIVLLQQYASDLQALPALLRFDRLQLKREQVNPDYEHLWLGLENFSVGTRRYPQFEFRLACANVRPKRFGSHPKLEFPAEGGRAPLENWFDEALDDFGEKLELRFALPDAMDITVWQALSARDHVLLTGLIALLPHLLAELAQQEVHISRAWADWQELALNVQNIHRDRCHHLAAAQVVHAGAAVQCDPAAPAAIAVEIIE